MTITLAELRDSINRHSPPAIGPMVYDEWIPAIDAAIRERDELRKHNDELRGCKFSERDWRALKYRAEQADAELAELRKRIEDAPTGRAVSEWKGLKCNLVVHDLPEKWHGRTVRLLVDDAPD